jgi:hypothetical protein
VFEIQYDLKQEDALSLLLALECAARGVQENKEGWN